MGSYSVTNCEYKSIVSYIWIENPLKDYFRVAVWVLSTLSGQK